AAIDAGTFERAADRLARERREATAPAPVAATTGLTLDQLGVTYFETHRNKRTGALLSRNERLRWDLTMRTDIARVNGERVRFGALPVDSVDALDIEALKAALVAPRIETVTNRRGTPTTRAAVGRPQSVAVSGAYARSSGGRSGRR